MKKIKRSKLYLAQETVRVLQARALRNAHGGDGIPYSKPQICTTTMMPTCGACTPPTQRCPSHPTCPITGNCPGSEGCSADCSFTCEDSCGGNCV